MRGAIMKARGRNLVHVFIPVLVGFLLVLTYTAYAASPTTQKSTQPAKTATSATTPASIKYDPNAPPKGTITIPASTKGNVNTSTWVTGSYQYIQWTCNGTSTNLVDVTLWQNNKQVVVISKGIASGQTAYIVPFGTAAGNYELRVTSKDDTRVEARRPVYIAPTAVTLETPPGALFSGSSYTVNWSYTGNPPSVKLVILDSSGTALQSVPNISIGVNGKGSWLWTVPAPPSGQSYVQCRFQIVGTFRTSVTSNSTADVILGKSNLFTIEKRHAMDIGCPDNKMASQKIEVSLKAPSGWGWEVPDPKLAGWPLQMVSPPVIRPGSGGSSSVLVCKYVYGWSAREAIPFVTLLYTLPDQYYRCSLTSYGALCLPK
jgi:hypothetical protein